MSQLIKLTNTFTTEARRHGEIGIRQSADLVAPHSPASPSRHKKNLTILTV